MVSKDHLYEIIIYCKSNGRMHDNITWPQKVKVVNGEPKIFEAPFFDNRAR